MGPGPSSRRWTPEEIEREAAVRRRRVLRDQARGTDANLAESVALTRFANRFARAFQRRRDT